MGKKIKRANGAGVPVTKFPRAPTSTDTPLASSTLPPTASTPGDAERTPFLDAFWKLADDDIKVRSNAGMVIIDHCYSPGVTADEGLNKDRSYALKRLMKGLCSGRGSARQGFASALQSFISAGQSQFTPEELHADLLLYTTPTGGGIKGTEERDGLFGCLFGILAIARSNIFVNVSSPPESATLFMKTTFELYKKKSWMRESSLNAALAILNTVSAETRVNLERTTCKEFIEESAERREVEAYALAIETNNMPLDKDSLSTYATSLVATSRSYPRLHLVWPLLFRKIVSSDNTIGLLRDLYEQVVLSKMVTSTHERKSVPLLLLSHVFSENIVTAAMLDVVLSEPVARLLLNVCTSDTNKTHFLKPLGLKVLEEIRVKFSAATFAKDANTDGLSLTLASSLLSIDVRFDSKTRTKLVETLLNSFDDSAKIEFVKFLEDAALKNAIKMAALLDAGGDDDDDDENCSKSSDSSESSRTSTSSEAKLSDLKNKSQGFLEALVASAKQFEDESLTQRVHGFLLTVAFFDVANLEVSEEPKKGKKKGKKKKEKMEAATLNCAVAAGLRVKRAFQEQKLQKQRHILPHSIRMFASSRFFSMLADMTTSEQKSALSSYRMTHAMWVAMETAGGVLIRSDLDDDCMQARVRCSELISLGEGYENDEEKKRELRFVHGTTILSMALALQLLNEGDEEEAEHSAMDVDDEDEVDHEVCQSIADLVTACKRSLGLPLDCDDEEDAEEEEEPLAEIADVCVSVMAMGNSNSSNGGRGSSIKGIRSATKNCWNGAIGLDSGQNSDVDETVVQVLLEGICDPIVMEEEEEEAIEEDVRMDEMDEASESESDSDNVVDNGENIITENKEPQSSPPPSSDEEDMMLDPDQLEKMLLEDSDDDGDDEQIEHHSGADAALAAMIKMKASGRKKGVEDRERISLAHRLRCFSLLEALFKKGKMGKTVLPLLIPLLETRRRLDKSCSKSSSSSNNMSVKREFHEKISKLFKERISKVKVEGEVDREIMEDLKKEAMKSPNSTHCGCVAFALVCCLKNGATADVLGELVENWSMNSQTKIHSVLFDEIISRTTSTGSAKNLIGPVLKATDSGRNEFTRAEAFRLAGRLFKEFESSDEAELLHFAEATKAGLNSAFGGTGGEGVSKTKRIRDIVGCVQQIVSLCSQKKSLKCWDMLQGEHFLKGMEGLKNTEGKGNLKVVAEKLLSDIAAGLLCCVEEEKPEDTSASKGGKGSKKKSKKKKR